ncbi:MAG: UDP-N-acetylglucosamine--LPS N-acetylglucosamine transferase [Myxococcota bacterium]
MTAPVPKVLAVSSGGGHWVQLQRLRPAFDRGRTVFVTVEPLYADEIPGASVRCVPDANRETPLRMLRMLLAVLAIVWRERPDVVISTGAAPGLFAILFGRLLGARTVWVDSVANAEQLSGSGHLVKRFAHLWLTQWPHLAGPGGPGYQGSVL